MLKGKLQEVVVAIEDLRRVKEAKRVLFADNELGVVDPALLYCYRRLNMNKELLITQISNISGQPSAEEIKPFAFIA